MQASPEFLRAAASFVAILVRERGLPGAATFLRELAASLDALTKLGDRRR
jgi:hypothetical protein